MGQNLHADMKGFHKGSHILEYFKYGITVSNTVVFSFAGLNWSFEVSWGWCGEKVCWLIPLSVFTTCVCIYVRLCDLHKSVNQLRPLSSSTSEDDHLMNDPVAWAEAKGGKKGDVLKLVSYSYIMSVTFVTHW